MQSNSVQSQWRSVLYFIGSLTAKSYTFCRRVWLLFCGLMIFLPEFRASECPGCFLDMQMPISPTQTEWPRNLEVKRRVHTLLKHCRRFWCPSKVYNQHFESLSITDHLGAVTLLRPCFRKISLMGAHQCGGV